MNGLNLRNIMNNFFIFGDSYSDNYDNYEIFPFEKMTQDKLNSWQTQNDYRWPYKLKTNFQKNFNFQNFSLMGTGPYHALKLLEKNTANLKKGDVIIFVISDFYRFKYFGLPSEIDFYSNNVVCDMSDFEPYWICHEKSISNRPNNFKKFKAYYEMNSENINYFFQMFFENLNPKNILLMFLTFLKNLANIKKLSKVIVFVKKFNDLNFDITNTVLNDKNFFHYHRELNEISREEYVKYNINLKQFDFRPNHLSKINHSIMYENIMQILNNDDNVVYNLRPFEKNIIDSGESSDHFIYE